MRTLPGVCLVLSLVPGAALARRPVLVELFTAQGCVTCNRADASVARWADRSDVIVLTWSVDYWDYLGWKDTFAQPEFAARQRAYDKRFGLRDVSTPQIIAGGVVQQSGDRTETLAELVKRARHERLAAPQIAFPHDGEVAIGSGRRPSGGGDVWLVRYNPTAQVVEVKAGDNHGASVSERNIATQLIRLGGWSGRSRIYKIPPASDDGLSTIVIVQDSSGGSILTTGVPKAK